MLLPESQKIKFILKHKMSFVHINLYIYGQEIEYMIF
jgi:hypothetical protein